MPLTAKNIENARPGVTLDGRNTAKPYKIGDSGGLFLLVVPSGGKLWRMRYRFDGKEKSLAFGAYPDVSLLKARELLDGAKQLLAQGIDPAKFRQEENAQERSARLAAKAQATIQVAVALDGTVRIWKGRAVINLAPAEALAVKNLLTKVIGEEPCR